MDEYRLSIIKPPGITHKEALELLGYKEPRSLKRYLMTLKGKTKTITTRQGKITYRLVPHSTNKGFCKVEECGRYALARGLCETHYYQWRRRNKCKTS